MVAYQWLSLQRQFLRWVGWGFRETMVIRLIQSQSCCNFSVHAHVLTKVTDNGKTSFCLGLAHSSPHSAQAHVVSSDLPETIPKMLSQHWLRSFSFVECLALGRGRAGQHSAPPNPPFAHQAAPGKYVSWAGPSPQVRAPSVLVMWGEGSAQASWSRWSIDCSAEGSPTEAQWQLPVQPLF